MGVQGWQRGLRAMLTAILVALLVISMASLPLASGQQAAPDDLAPLAGSPRWVSRASTNVLLRFTGRWQLMKQRARRATASPPGPPPLATVFGNVRVFNRDQSALPQNETSVAIDPKNLNRIVGVYNDYRGSNTGNYTGWSISNDAGVSVGKDGQVPTTIMWGLPVNSQGDPTVDADKDGNFFLAGLHFDPLDAKPNGITIARSPKAGSATGVFSAACTGGIDPDCWPTIRVLVQNGVCNSSYGHFEDKPYMAVDDTASIASGHVYVVWTRFPCYNDDSQILIAKCDNALAACTDPVLLDRLSGPYGSGLFVQLSHLAVAPDGSVYVTWVRHSTAWTSRDGWHEVATIMLRKILPTAATAGVSVGTVGPLQTVAVETQPIPWKWAPYPAYYRTATYPHVAVDGSRVVVVWDRRSTMGGRSGPPGAVLVKPSPRWWFDYGTLGSIVARFSDDGGTIWGGVQTVSNAWGPQYQPSICVESTTGKVVVAFFSHQDDPFGHAQDVYLAISDNGAAPYVPLRVTSSSNDTEADPTLSDFFIGDYIEVACRAGRAYVHFTANYQAKWFSMVEGLFYARQQDTFMVRVTLP